MTSFCDAVAGGRAPENASVAARGEVAYAVSWEPLVAIAEATDCNEFQVAVAPFIVVMRMHVPSSRGLVVGTMQGM